jgi:hypothetical protein
MTTGPVKRTCGRCARHRYPAAHFPDGYLCGTCLQAALDIRGACPGCGTIRALPGRRPNGQTPICRDCAGITRHFTCLHCDYEGNLARSRLCHPCAVTQAITEIFGDTRHLSPALRSLTDALATAPNPAATARWLARPALQLPQLRFAKGEAITQHRRLALLRHYVTDDHAPARIRAIACLMLLYAQPLSRVLRLTVSDITQGDDGQVHIRFGHPPTPIPEPFAGLLLQLIADQPATSSNWLFPGRNPGQPAAYATIFTQLRGLGFPMRTARISALRQLVLQAPAPVIAEALGFHYTTTERQHANAGATWNRYPAGDHTK